MRQIFVCLACSHSGIPIHGIEQEEADSEDERHFVGCEECGTRHLVERKLDLRGDCWGFTVAGLMPECA